MADFRNDQRRMLAARERQRAPGGGWTGGLDVFDTALRPKPSVMPAPPQVSPPINPDQWSADAAAGLIDTATLGFGDEILGAGAAPFKGRGTYAQERAAAQQAIARDRQRQADFMNRIGSRIKRTATDFYNSLTPDDIAGGAATFLDTASLGTADDALAAILSQFKGRRSAEEERALFNRLKDRFRGR